MVGLSHDTLSHKTRVFDLTYMYFSRSQRSKSLKMHQNDKNPSYSQTKLFPSILTYYHQLSISYIHNVHVISKIIINCIFSGTPCGEQARSVIHSLSVSTTTFNLTFHATPGEHMVHEPFH
jgi:hypothetical protein